MPLNRKPPLGNVRQVQTTGRNLRYTLTNKTGRIVQCESQQERKLALLLERDRTVRDYGSQPEALYWQEVNGKQHTYVPDFIVWRVDGHVEFHEVTLTMRQSDPQQHNRQLAAHHICEERGWQYIVHMEDSLPNDTVTANLFILYAYRSRSFAHAAVQSAIELQLHTVAQPLCQLLPQLETHLGLPQPTLQMAVLHLLWHDILETDLNCLLFRDGTLLPEIRIGWKGEQR